jgi:hypothetical protein
VNKLPILIIGFIRVEGVQRLIDSLLGEQIQCVYLSLDGPRDANEIQEQEKIIAIVSEFSNSNALPFYLRRCSSNFGVAVGVMSALDWYFSKVSFGVILEDDLVVGNEFIPFISKVKSEFETQKDIVMISGNQFNSMVKPSKLSATHYPQIWGWATNSEKWEVLRNGLLSQGGVLLRDFISPRNSFWAVGARRALLGKVDTWDLPLAKFMKRHSMVCLLPPVNLVTNVGADKFAAHTKENQFPLFAPIESFDTNKLSTEIPTNSETDKMDKYLEINVFRIGPLNLFSLPFGLLRMLRHSDRSTLESRLIASRINSNETP